MKESIGSTLLMQIFFILFVVIISFMAVAINYAKVFVIKNDIITIIEKNKGYNSIQIDDYLEYRNYSSESNNLKVVKHINDDSSYYYSIVVYSVFKVPLINQSLKIPVRGNTETIINIVDQTDEVNYAEESVGLY
ncbi:MAG TPA: hypothetical protein PLT65_00405 [Bacilli bacterium]|nr:hypothetical protein [Bacilli bacterium]